MSDEGALIERAKQGDREAFGSLAKRYQQRVYATAFHITGNHGEADDVAQDALVRAFCAMPSYEGRAGFYTWLYRIVVNTALNHLRERKRQAAFAISPESLSASDPGLDTESRELLVCVTRALAELSEPLRVTLMLAAVEEMPYKEIAELFGCPVGTVAWRVNQARKLLRRKLAALLPDTTGWSTDEVLRRTKEIVGAR